jgi:hypothetical protein
MERAMEPSMTHIRTMCRLAAVVLVELVAALLFVWYLDARRRGNWNYDANLWMALVTAGLGLVGWFFPRAVGWVTIPFTALWLLWALAYTGPSLGAAVTGGVPVVVSFLFIFGRRPAMARWHPRPR